jgi:hypothetical protein
MKLFRGWQRALALLIGSTVALNAAHAAAPQVKTQAPGYYRLMLGDFEVTVLRDGSLSLPASILTNTTEAETGKALARNFQKSPFDASDNAFLINTGAKLVLIDAGSGSLMGPTAGNLLTNLSAAMQRQRAYADAAKAGYLIGTAHLAFPGIGHIRAEGKGYAWVPVSYSAPK